jgi:hypothetical protein
VTKITGIKLVDLDYSALADVPLDAANVELYRGQFQRWTNPPIRCGPNRYSGRVIVLDEAGRHIACSCSRRRARFRAGGNCG